MSRKKNAQAPNHERWLVSYADFITLLFAFFVVMYASSQVDHRKVGKLAMAIQVAFQQLGVFPASNTKLPLSTTQPMPFSTVQAIENIPESAELARVAPLMQGSPAIPPGVSVFQLAELHRELEKALAPQLKRKEVAIKSHGGELVISLREVGFFPSGSATLLPKAQVALSRLAAVLAKHPYFLRIEGYTDSVPIHNRRFASNWELSTARATEIVALLISRYHFSPQRLSAAGYAQYHPVASNKTPSGRALNRRVDIVISPTPSQQFATAEEAEKVTSSFSPSPSVQTKALPAGTPGAANSSKAKEQDSRKN